MTLNLLIVCIKLFKASGISWDTLWNAREKGNTLIVRRRDNAPFKIGWSNIHPNCFEARKEERRLKEREQELREEANRRKMLGEMTEEVQAGRRRRMR